jgi:group II intron reverse transcriptase/maturase
MGKQRSPYPPWQSAFSLPALRRAWLHVRANKGRGGSDGETIAQFEAQLELNLRQLQQELTGQRYRPRHVTQVLVPKPSGGWRPLTLWAIRDRVVQRAAYDYLEPAFETRFLNCSYGFRRGRTTQDAAEAIMNARRDGAHWVLDADIKDCFSQMRNDKLLYRLRRWRVPGPMQELIRRWLNARIWNAWRGSATVAGTSQGGVISPLMCNLYLHPFDQAMQQRGLHLVRYADDFVIMARHKTVLQGAKLWVTANLKRLGLQLHPQKTRVTSFDAGFQFVGWFFIRDEKYQLK